MSDTRPDGAPAEAGAAASTDTVPVRRRRRGRLGVLHAVWVLLVAGVAAVAVLSVTGATLRLPDRVTARIEAAVNARIEGPRLRIGHIDLRFGSDGRPQVRLANVEVMDGAGNSIARLNDLGAGLSPGALIEGRIVPRTVRLSGAQVTLRRDAAGGIAISFGGLGGALAATPGEAVELVDRVFAGGFLAGTERIEARDVTLTLEDARSGRVWQATDGTLEILSAPEALTVTIVSEVFNGTENLAPVELSYSAPRGGRAARVEARFENAAAADLALQSPALALLALIEAPISGALGLDIEEDGALGRLFATLDIGAGQLRPPTGAPPVPFERARAVVAFDPDTGRIAVPELAVKSALASLEAEAHLMLGAMRGGWPADMIAQVRIRDLDLDAGEVLAGPVSFDRGLADLRVTLDPFAVEIGQAVLEGPHGRQEASGRIGAEPAGWRIALDIVADEIPIADAVALWPLRVTPGVRTWIATNVAAGRLRDFTAALRAEPGARIVTALSFAFAEAEVKVLPNLPPITGAAGLASLHGARFALALDSGRMDPGEGPPADLAGSTLVLPDLSVRPNPAELRLAAAGPAASILRLLDNPPFGVLGRIERPEPLLAAAAEARVAAEVHFPMKGQLVPADVAYTVTGALADVAAEDLVPGRNLAAERLSLRVTPGEVEIAGPVVVDGLALDATYRLPLGPPPEPDPDTGTATGTGAAVTGRLMLTPETLPLLGVSLPPGSVAGAAAADVALDLRPDGMGFRLTSDLVGARLSVAPLGWSKPPATPARLEVAGEMQDGRAQVDALRLEAPGLSASGRVEAATGVIRLERVRAGSWLDAGVTLTPRGPGRAPAVVIEGGRLNLAARPAAAGGGGGDVPMRVTLDRLTIAEGLALAPFRGAFVASSGLSGDFEGRVNGGVAVRGTLVPSGGSTAARITAEDGGAVMRDAGIYPNARGGAFEMILVPTEGEGRYDGQLSIGRTRIVNAPGLASLLNAISVVGLLAELQGSGILFETVDARFDLSPGRVILREGAAVGASLGISMDGVYDIASKSMDMQGVVSPVYLLNGIGQILTRPGEGLFGFAYRMTGGQDQLRIEVNPLSILTPGMFRDIFRRPLPAAGP